MRAGNWKWVIPPVNPTLSPCYMQLNKMTEYTLLPAYVYSPSYKDYSKMLKVRRTPDALDSLAQ